MSKHSYFVVWGCKGQAKVLAEIIYGKEEGIIVAFFESNKSMVSPIPGVPVHYGLDGYKEWLLSWPSGRAVSAIAAIGGDSGRARLEYMQVFEKDGLLTKSLVHPTSSILTGASIGRNCQILAHSVVGIDTVLGDGCIVNTKASIDHECNIADGVHIAPGATLCGEVRVGACSFIAAGAIILPRIKIGSNTLVGAGSVVTKDVPDNVIIYGNPARIIREKKYV